MTFARIFVNSKDAKMYEEAFKAVFRLMSKQLNEDICWKYLHGKGLSATISDMDIAQLKGK
jgi:hypothetical protein